MVREHFDANCSVITEVKSCKNYLANWIFKINSCQSTFCVQQSVKSVDWSNKSCDCTTCTLFNTCCSTLCSCGTVHLKFFLCDNRAAEFRIQWSSGISCIFISLVPSFGIRRISILVYCKVETLRLFCLKTFLK
jgi:hypothetical protein